MAIKTARKKPRKKLGADQYAAIGGPVDRLYLPWPHANTPPAEHLPVEIPFGSDGTYIRVAVPHGGGTTYAYEWKGLG